MAPQHGLQRILSPTNPGEEIRALWVAPEALDLMDGVTDAFFPVVRFAVVTSNFSLGRLMRVSTTGDQDEKLPNIERLHTVDEVWTLCCRSPKAQQYRFFGRFTAKNELVLLFGRSRISLTGVRYQVAIEEFQTRWNEMFPDGEHYRANALEDYLGGVVVDVDEL